MSSPPVSIFHLAGQLGVSATTVSRVLNNRDGIGAKTRHRVWAAARAAGYRPQQQARRTTIGLLVDYVGGNTTSTFVPRLTTLVMAELAKHGFVVDVFSPGNLASVAQAYVDGFLGIAWEPASIAALGEVTGVPIVIINRPEYPRFSCVRSDSFDGGRQVASHLLHHGHRHLGVISDNLGVQMRAAIAGVRSTLEAAGLSLNPRDVVNTDFGDAEEPLARLLARKPTAIWIASDELTYRVPYLCRERFGLRTPDDVSIVGTADLNDHAFNSPPLTVVSDDMTVLVGAVMKTLIDQITHQDTTPRIVTTPMRLIERASVRSAGHVSS